jgi:hypothetical protein
MSMLTSLEAFVGVLYAAFCGAILFSKITRIQGYGKDDTPFIQKMHLFSSVVTAHSF